MNISNRIKILKKLAQATAPVTKPSVSGQPTFFNVGTLYQDVNTGLTPTNVDHLTELMGYINNALYYTSSGDIELIDLKISNFVKDVSGVIPDLKNIILLTQLIYYNLMTDHGNKFKKQLTSIEIKKRVDTVLTSTPLNNLSSVNPTGQLATKLPTNLKELIKTTLGKIK
jgi:hypothetical protein